MVKILKQPWELGIKCGGNFILTFAVAKARHGSITKVKIVVKNLLFLVAYRLATIHYK